MNKERVNEINRQIKILNEVLLKLNLIKSNEEDSLDNIPDNLRNSCHAIDSENAIDSLEDAIDEIENAIESLNEV